MAQDFAPSGNYFGASHIGNRPEMIAMLELASSKKIQSWIKTVPISAKGCAEVTKGVNDNKLGELMSMPRLLPEHVLTFNRRWRIPVRTQQVR